MGNVEITKHGVLLDKTELGFEIEGVLNPAVISENGNIHLFYRAVGKGNYSSIGYCKLLDPLTVESRKDTPVIFPQYDYETHGVEDPRISKVDDEFYLTYTAYDGVNALGALAVSTDLISFEKRGILVPILSYSEFIRLASVKGPINEKYERYNEHGRVAKKSGKDVYIWDKNVIFFPERIGGKIHFIHRIRPDIHIVAVNTLSDLTPEFWQDYFMNIDQHILLSPQYEHEVSYIGGGCPPIRTDKGWLLIYHGVHDTIDGYIYSACAALLDLENPQKEIARLPIPLFIPDQEWEKKGAVNNVCFPTGALVVDDVVYIYYGAADERVACASARLSMLVDELLLNKRTDQVDIPIKLTDTNP